MVAFIVKEKLLFTSSRTATVLVILTFSSLLQFALQLGALTKGVEYIVSTLTIDDSYYYFQTAWNVKIFGFPTFDGLHPTNGVQLLWFWILALLAKFISSKISFLYAALALGFLFNSSCYIVIWKIGTTLKHPRLAIYMASLWFLFSVGSVSYSRGLENSLHALVFWGCIWQATSFLSSLYQGKKPSLVSLTVVLVFNVWTRLDAAIFSLVLYGYCVYKAFRLGTYHFFNTRHIQNVIGTGILAVVGLSIQLLVFKWMGNSYLPVSALIKGSVATWHPMLIESVLRLGMPFALPSLLGIPAILTNIVLERSTRTNQQADGRQAWREIWLCLLLASLIHLAMLAPGGIPYWYRSPEYIFWIITFAMIVDRTQELIIQKGFPTVARLFLGGVNFVAITIAILLFSQRLSLYYSELYTGRYDVAIWMSKNLPDDAICASWNAGQLGFFSERTVINLDGLINSSDYFYSVLRGPISLEQYLVDNKVDCIVDYEDDIVPKHLPEVAVFPAGGQIIRLWKVNPSLSIGNP